MDHVPRVVYHDAAMICNRFVPSLLVGPPGPTAFLAFDDEHRTFDAAQEFQGLGGIKWLGRGGAMERIELPGAGTIFPRERPSCG